MRTVLFYCFMQHLHVNFPMCLIFHCLHNFRMCSTMWMQYLGQPLRKEMLRRGNPTPTHSYQILLINFTILESFILFLGLLVSLLRRAAFEALVSVPSEYNFDGNCSMQFDVRK